MSRAYRISVRESLRKMIKGTDHVSSELELLQILPKENMASLLVGELEQRGFRREGNVLVREDDGGTVTIDPSSGSIKVATEICEEIELENTSQGWADEDFGRRGRAEAEESLRKRAQKDLARQADGKEQRLTEKATAQLEGVLRDLQTELDEVVNRVTAEALKQKAAQIGEIKQVTEDLENGSMTIVVDV